MNWEEYRQIECEDTGYVAPVCPSEECPAETLVLKPSTVITRRYSTVTYQTFLVTASGEETLISEGLEYDVLHPSVAIIGVSSGVATAVAPGFTTVTVKWAGMYAFAQLTVVEACVDNLGGLYLLFDRSHSMSQTMNEFGSKLAVAQGFAQNFIDWCAPANQIAVGGFATTLERNYDLGVDRPAAKQAVRDMATQSARTSLYNSVALGAKYLSDQTLDMRVLLLFSDGEENTGGVEPDSIQTFKDKGGIVIVVGMRAHDAGFQKLAKLATPGFFLNCYPDATNIAETNAYLLGFLGWFCAGNCGCVCEDTTGGMPHLQYMGFINWRVISGSVDLIGSGAASIFDLIPGNGLYVDMVGSGEPWMGKIRTRVPIVLNDEVDSDLEHGTTYILACDMAGNQRRHQGTDDDDTVAMRIIGQVHGVGADFVAAEQNITINRKDEPFAEYTLELTTPATGEYDYYFEFETLSYAYPSYGLLLDNVTFYAEDTPDTLIFEDDFDNENPVTLDDCYHVDPNAPYGYRPYNYDCTGQGCLTNPPPEQVPDPTPLEIDVEINIPACRRLRPG